MPPRPDLSRVRHPLGASVLGRRHDDDKGDWAESERVAGDAVNPSVGAPAATSMSRTAPSTLPDSALVAPPTLVTADVARRLRRRVGVQTATRRNLAELATPRSGGAMRAPRGCAAHRRQPNRSANRAAERGRRPSGFWGVSARPSAPWTARSEPPWTGLRRSCGHTPEAASPPAPMRQPRRQRISDPRSAAEAPAQSGAPDPHDR